jgi:hypothetical protein
MQVVRGAVLRDENGKELVLLGHDDHCLTLAGEEIIFAPWNILDTHKVVRYANEDMVDEMELRLLSA